jgi:hypothetical protein
MSRAGAPWLLRLILRTSSHSMPAFQSHFAMARILGDMKPRNEALWAKGWKCFGVTESRISGNYERMTKEAINTLYYGWKWAALFLVFPAVLNSCSEMNQIREYNDNPLCKEMKRKCKEYDEYKELVGKKKSQWLNQLREDCREYSKSCGHAVGEAGD